MISHSQSQLQNLDLHVTSESKTKTGYQITNRGVAVTENKRNYTQRQRLLFFFCFFLHFFVLTLHSPFSWQCLRNAVLLTLILCFHPLQETTTKVIIGYYYIQGTVLNSWKVVWVVLADDGIEFYKKKTDSSPKGMIPLKEAVLTTPCQDYSKRTVMLNANI